MAFSFLFGQKKMARRSSRSSRWGGRHPRANGLALEQLEARRLFAGLPVSIGGIGQDVGESITTDVWGNFFVAGKFQGTVDFDPGPNTANLTSNYSGKTPTMTSDGFIAKYAPDGTFLWARRFGGTGDYDQALSVVTDPAGNAYLAGSFQGTSRITGIDAGNIAYSHSILIDSGGSKGGVSSKSAALVVKFNPGGAVAWAKQFGGEATATDIAVHTDSSNSVDSVYIVGDFLNTVDFNPDPIATRNLTAAGVIDNFVVKLNGTGVFDWAMKVGSTGWDYSAGIDVGSDGSSYITGRFEGTAQFGPYALTSNGGQSDGYIAKVNPTGNVLWAKNVGGTDYDMGGDIRVNGGSLYVTGFFTTTATGGATIGGINLPGIGGRDIFISKLNVTDGAVQWANQLGGTGTDSGSRLFIDENEDIYLAGYFSESVDFDPGSGETILTALPTTGPNGYVTKLRSDGVFGGWATRLGSAATGPSTSTSRARSITWDPTSNSLLVSGYFSGTLAAYTGTEFSGPTLTSLSGSNDVFVAKLDRLTGKSILANSPSLLLASTNASPLIDYTVGRNWFTLSTPGDDSKFIRQGDQSKMLRMPLPIVPLDEIDRTSSLVDLEDEDDDPAVNNLAAGKRSVGLRKADSVATDLALLEFAQF